MLATFTKSAALLIFVIGLSVTASAADVVEGKKAPDFSATDIKGDTVKLSDWIGKKKLVIVFSRANWCPYCMGQLADLSKNYDAIKKQDAEVLVVFREEREGPAGLKKSTRVSGGKFPLLLDLNKKTTAAYSTTGFTTYIIGKDGNVKKILAGTKPKRPKTEAILKALGKQL
ncbi:MAG: peroxiredoxin family protein [Pirellulales bacterium]|jgi:peroxiredoxin